jgi:hypothetical protein
MAQIKAQDTNWLDQAWRISAVIAAMPDNPPGLLSASRKWPPLTGETKQHIELLQDTIALHLAYRSKVIHKASIALPDGDKAMFWLNTREPATTAKAMAFLVKIGVELQSVDLWAYDAHIKLGRILIDRYVCKEWKRQLPLIVASIGGQTTSQTAKLKARQPRPRPPNELKDEKFRAQGRNEFSTWKELLDDLQGEEIVIQWDNSTIQWSDSEGNTRTTATQTFKNWKLD